MFLFTEPVKGYERIWVIGDDFMAKSYAEHFQNAFDEKDMDYNNAGFLKSHYDVTGFCRPLGTNSLVNSNVIGRVRNQIVKAINLQVTFPKAIIIVLDCDLLKVANHYTDGFTAIIDEMLAWLSVEIHRIILAHKEKLPTKARKYKYPHVFWVAPVHHNNFTNDENYFVRRFNTCLFSVTDKYQEMSTMMLNTWDPHDGTLVSNSVFTSEGLKKYWNCIDAAFQKWDRDQMNSMQKSAKASSFAVNNRSRQQNFPRRQQSRFHADKYHWSRHSSRP